jgi:hypothetical protein
MKRSMIAMAALAAMGASAAWDRRSADEPRGHELRATNVGGLFAENDDDLAGLSEAERAALAEPDENEESLRAIAGKETPDDKAPPDDKAATNAGADDTAETGDEAVDDKNKPAAAPAPTNAPATTPAPPPEVQEPVAYSVLAPEDADDKIKALRTEKAGAFKKLMDGDMSPEEYSVVEDRVLGDISNIERQVTVATTAAELTMQNAQRSWLQRVNATIDSALKNDGIDYRANKELNEQLDRGVKFLANDPANADKPEQWFLDEAHAMVKARNGIAKPATSGPAASPPASTSRAGKAPDLSGVHPNIARQPAAADSDDGGEFSHLNGLTGMALERAVAKMTPDQQDRWAQES